MLDAIGDALVSCALAATSGDARAFQIAHWRLESAMMRLSLETWALCPRPPAKPPKPAPVIWKSKKPKRKAM